MDKFIQTLARKAGEITLKYFGDPGRVRTKTHATDVVSRADLESNRFIVAAIKKRFPSHGIVSEEADKHHDGAEYMWYVDPLDGSFNFVRGVPVFCTMIGLAYRGRMIVGAIYDPNLRRMYFAKQGQGAFLNGKRIHCSERRTWQDCYGSMPGNMRSRDKIAFVERLTVYAKKNPCWLGAVGSAGINASLTAQGSFDWWASIWGEVWDYAAAGLLLKEAGCVVTTKEGKPWKPGDISCIAANKYLHPQLMKLVQGGR